MNTGSQLVSPDNTFPEIDDRLYFAVRGMILWLQGVFKTRPSGSYRWDPDAEQSEIIITAHNPHDAERTNKRPNIVVARQGAGYVGSSMGQTMAPMFTRDTATYSDMLRTGLIITVIAREGLEAQSIAYGLFRLVPMFRGVLNRTGRMTVLPGQMTITPEMPWVDTAPNAAAPHRRAVVVSLPITIQDTFTIGEGAHTAFLHDVEAHITEST